MVPASLRHVPVPVGAAPARWHYTVLWARGHRPDLRHFSQETWSFYWRGASVPATAGHCFRTLSADKEMCVPTCVNAHTCKCFCAYAS